MRKPIEQEYRIEAPIERVWDAVATGEGLERWFPMRAEVVPPDAEGKGGTVSMWWGDFGGASTITEWKPMERYSAHAEGYGTMTFELRADKGETIFKVIQSEIPDGPEWDGIYDSTTRGWNTECRALRHYMKFHEGTERRVVWAVHPIGSDAAFAEAWDRLMGAVDSKGEMPSGLKEGDAYSVTMATGQELEGIVEYTNAGRDFAGTATNLNNAFFRMRVDDACDGTGKREATLWLGTYGIDAAEVAKLESSWKALLGELFPEAASVE